MDEPESIESTLEPELHKFLVKQGIPIERLPKLIQVPKPKLVPIMEGYAKQNKTKIFYICVCNSGHAICCGEWTWNYSGWSFRLVGAKVIFFNGDWKFNISQIPIFQDTLFVVSKRTITNEYAQSRSDVICVDSRRRKLLRKTKKAESNRRNCTCNH